MNSPKKTGITWFPTRHGDDAQLHSNYEHDDEERQLLYIKSTMTLVKILRLQLGRCNAEFSSANRMRQGNLELTPALLQSQKQSSQQQPIGDQIKSRLVLRQHTEIHREEAQLSRQAKLHLEDSSFASQHGDELIRTSPQRICVSKTTSLRPQRQDVKRFQASDSEPLVAIRQVHKSPWEHPAQLPASDLRILMYRAIVTVQKHQKFHPEWHRPVSAIHNKKSFLTSVFAHHKPLPQWGRTYPHNGASP